MYISGIQVLHFWIQKIPTYFHKRALRTSAKETWKTISSSSRYIPAQKSCICVQEPYVSAKETYTWMQISPSAQETWPHGKETILQQKGPGLTTTRQLFGQKDCNTLQHAATETATPCSTLQQRLQHPAARCNTLQHFATHCNNPIYTYQTNTSPVPIHCSDRLLAAQP